MPHELLYTSAVRGLHLGTDGYTTVAETPAIPKSLAAQLERLSGYRHRVKGKSPDLVNNPVAFSHVEVNASGVRYHVVSRIADAGFDHTHRTNYLAHHIALTVDELPTAGPAWLLSQKRVFQTEWPVARKPMQLPPDRRLPIGDFSPRKCDLWERLVGDAGWAGVLAGTHISRDPVYIIYEPGQPILECLSEAIALIPPAHRWRVTLNTYFTDSGGTDCRWRCILADSREADVAMTARSSLIFRFDKQMPGEPIGELVTAARTGILPLEPLPENEPPRRRSFALQPSRRQRPVADEVESALPNDELETSGASIGVNPMNTSRPNSASGSPVKTLIMGLALGMGLALVCTILLELTGGKSLLRRLKVISQPEKDLIRDHSEAEKKWQEEKGGLEKAREDEKGEKNQLHREAQLRKEELGKASEQIKQSNDEIMSKEAALKAALNEVQKLSQKLAALPQIAEPISLTLGQAHGVLSADEDAIIELIVPSGWGESDREHKQPIKVRLGNSKKGELTYDQKTGSVKLTDSDPGLPTALWGGAVLKVVEKKSNSTAYFQLAEPRSIPIPDEMTEFTLDVFEKLKTTAKAWPETAILAFGDDATVKIGGQDYLLKNAGPNGEKFPTTLSYKDESLTIDMRIKGGKIIVKVDGKNEANKKATVTQAVIVPERRVEGLAKPPVILRIE